eukprot:CAMPEP_0202859606 /NCGR_PEP_ID=MMETSP1391-20130828/1648_1 /ASSEMBLY_ACC=CAM_ASM_000867 /TAXON_ID=1034604 /ORGANISM="Chlamydomonas leiostraca, Strain SAG 11-49" /LENGTH=197 /DNA_ID=CAMNT_0049538655 /DNA_START=77 /DNA_END=666 /DNA_ORIENTATION=+
MCSQVPSSISALHDPPEEAVALASGDIQRYAQAFDSKSLLDDRSRTVGVNLEELENLTRCPICYGKIKSARVSTVCLHRFCAQCIDRALRCCDLPGRPPEAKECPVCRAHMHSRRDAKRDPRFDVLMRALYGDVAAYEAAEEEAMAAQRAHLLQVAHAGAAGGAGAGSAGGSTLALTQRTRSGAIVARTGAAALAAA